MTALVAAVTLAACRGTHESPAGERFALSAVGDRALPAPGSCGDLPVGGTLGLRPTGKYVAVDSVETECVGGVAGRVVGIVDSGRVVRDGARLRLFSDVEPGGAEEPYAEGEQRGDTLWLMGPGDADPYVYVHRK